MIAFACRVVIAEPDAERRAQVQELMINAPGAAFITWLADDLEEAVQLLPQRPDCLLISDSMTASNISHLANQIERLQLVTPIPIVLIRFSDSLAANGGEWESHVVDILPWEGLTPTLLERSIRYSMHEVVLQHLLVQSRQNQTASVPAPTAAGSTELTEALSNVTTADRTESSTEHQPEHSTSLNQLEIPESPQLATTTTLETDPGSDDPLTEPAQSEPFDTAPSMAEPSATEPLTGESAMVEPSTGQSFEDGDDSDVVLVSPSTELATAAPLASAAIDDTEISAWMQTRFLPTGSPMIDGFDIAGLSKPALGTGGDFYDFLTLKDGRVGIAVGDVTGCGREAATAMLATRCYLRAWSSEMIQPGGLLERANDLLVGDIREGDFVTLFLAAIDPRNHEIVFAAAGQQAMLIRAQGTLETLKSTSMPLGIRTETVVRTDGPLALQAGDALVMATDGAFKTRSRSGEQLTPQHLAQTVVDHQNLPSRLIASMLERQCREFAGGRSLEDDFTVVVARRVD